MTLTTDLLEDSLFFSTWTQLMLDIQATAPDDRNPVDQMLLEAFMEQVKDPDVLTPQEDDLWDQILREWP